MLLDSDRRLKAAAIAACGLLSFWTGASAQAPAKEGTYDYTTCWSGTSNLMAFSRTHSAVTFEFTGTTRSNIPGSIFDKNMFRCIGFSVTLDGKTSGSNACASVDKDGDKRMSLFTNVDGKTTRETVAGTGKYVGMTTTDGGDPARHLSRGQGRHFSELQQNPHGFSMYDLHGCGLRLLL